jgi:hypothetical protein
VRSLIEATRLAPEGGSLRVEVRGEMASILRLAAGAGQGEAAGVSAGGFFWIAFGCGDRI